MEIPWINEFETKGLINISYPADLRASVDKAVETWRKFCQLSETEKTKFPYNRNAGMGVGYELKKAEGANLDVKEDFHFTIGAAQWLKETAQVSGLNEATALIDNAGTLIDIMEPFVLDFAHKIQTSFALQGFQQEIADSKPIWFVRFLHYFPGQPEGANIATPHADKSGFTLHLYESDPGLQYFGFDHQWKDMNVSANETVIIPGMRLQYRSHGQLKALYHQVVATQKTAQQGRFSIVCFIHLIHTPEYNKQKAGRLQEFQPGFNYDMPFDEFAKLFA